MDSLVDLRSDTVTVPTHGMREAIAAAEVGDDSLGGDPTTKRLEARVAELLGKEAALFFPSGVMANQAALSVLGRPGTEVALEADAHIFHYEEGAAGVLSGLQLHRIFTPDGMLTPELLECGLRSGSRYQPETSVVALENTHLGSGGRVIPIELARSLKRIAEVHGIPVHLDGARLWHASASSGLEVGEYAGEADSVMVALSKGLGAPVGSILASSREVIDAAWRVRRRFGGGMRQTGILTAAGLYALDHHLPRISESHELARALADGVSRTPGLKVIDPETNVVMIDIENPLKNVDSVLGFLKKHGILMVPFGLCRIRAVTHLDVDSADITRTINILGSAMA